jgi:hypothetical protein
MKTMLAIIGLGRLDFQSSPIRLGNAFKNLVSPAAHDQTAAIGENFSTAACADGVAFHSIGSGFYYDLRDLFFQLNPAVKSRKPHSKLWCVGRPAPVLTASGAFPFPITFF